MPRRTGGRQGAVSRGVDQLLVALTDGGAVLQVPRLRRLLPKHAAAEPQAQQLRPLGRLLQAQEHALHATGG